MSISKMDTYLNTYISEYEKLTNKPFLEDNKCDRFHNLYKQLESYFRNEYIKDSNKLLYEKNWYKIEGQVEIDMLKNSTLDIGVVFIFYSLYLFLGMFIDKTSIKYLSYICLFCILTIGFILFRCKQKKIKRYKANFKLFCVSIIDEIIKDNKNKIKTK